MRKRSTARSIIIVVLVHSTTYHPSDLPFHNSIISVLLEVLGVSLHLHHSTRALDRRTYSRTKNDARHNKEGNGLRDRGASR